MWRTQGARGLSYGFLVNRLPMIVLLHFAKCHDLTRTKTGLQMPRSCGSGDCQMCNVLDLLHSCNPQTEMPQKQQQQPIATDINRQLSNNNNNN